MYISGNAINILTGPHSLIQTIYLDECVALESLALSEGTGKIAACDSTVVYVYRPYGKDEGALKVCTDMLFLVASNLTVNAVVVGKHAPNSERET